MRVLGIVGHDIPHFSGTSISYSIVCDNKYSSGYVSMELSEGVMLTVLYSSASNKWSKCYINTLMIDYPMAIYICGIILYFLIYTARFVH